MWGCPWPTAEIPTTFLLSVLVPWGRWAQLLNLLAVSSMPHPGLLPVGPRGSLLSPSSLNLPLPPQEIFLLGPRLGYFSPTSIPLFPHSHPETRDAGKKISSFPHWTPLSWGHERRMPAVEERTSHSIRTPHAEAVTAAALTQHNTVSSSQLHPFSR